MLSKFSLLVMASFCFLTGTLFAIAPTSLFETCPDYQTKTCEDLDPGCLTHSPTECKKMETFSYYFCRLTNSTNRCKDAFPSGSHTCVYKIYSKVGSSCSDSGNCASHGGSTVNSQFTVTLKILEPCND